MSDQVGYLIIEDNKLKFIPSTKGRVLADKKVTAVQLPPQLKLIISILTKEDNIFLFESDSSSDSNKNILGFVRKAGVMGDMFIARKAKIKENGSIVEVPFAINVDTDSICLINDACEE